MIGYVLQNSVYTHLRKSISANRKLKLKTRVCDDFRHLLNERGTLSLHTMRPFLHRLGTSALVICHTSRITGAFLFTKSGNLESNGCNVKFRRLFTETTAMSDRSRFVPNESSMGVDDTSKPSQRTFRVLALHGSGETGDRFLHRLDVLKMAAADENVHLDITTIDAPFPKADGFAWWEMPPGVRSFTAERYAGLEESISRFLDVYDSFPRFDLVLGHSQGGIFISVLLLLGKMPYYPSVGYILNGAAMPNPYRTHLTSLDVKKEDPPRVLFIMGQSDKIVPLSILEQLRDGFQEAGFPVSSIHHPGGHSFPNERDGTMQSITAWIAEASENQ